MRALRDTILWLEGGYAPRGPGYGPTLYGIDASSWPQYASRIVPRGPAKLTLDEAVSFYQKHFIAEQFGTAAFNAVFTKHQGLALAIMFNTLHGAPADRRVNDVYDLLALQTWWKPSKSRVAFAWSSLSQMSSTSLARVAAELYRSYPVMYRGRLALFGAAEQEGIRTRLDRERSLLLHANEGAIVRVVGAAKAGVESVKNAVNRIRSERNRTPEMNKPKATRSTSSTARKAGESAYRADTSLY